MTYTVPVSGIGAPEVTLLEAHSVLASSGTTGMRTWEASLLLGSYLYSPSGKDLIQNRTILELGAGTGFLSILCVKHLNACYVLATDGNAEVINHLDTNLYINGIKERKSIETSTFKWGDPLTGVGLNDRGNSRSYDLVLGADLVCHNSVAP